ncbi:macrophage mannose receptor 1-like [Patiria miniata]|uniref:C-type lectin domain-containing protein n=1 Tax=Patiria miniata TaxID=46514 RepID=A0A914BNX9_PATMI|nr:macrophage mannose receptor 1-like [Patiria miniata]
MYTAGDTCVVLKTDSKKNFYEAQKDCKAYDTLTDLVVIKDDAMNTWVANLVNSVNDRFMLGLSDQGQEGKFVWVNGDELDQQANNPNWNTGEPNNSGNEDCVTMLPTGKWNDVGCGTSYYFICQRPNDVPLACDEDNGWTTGVERCFRYYGYSMTWADARQYCQDREADLLQIHSDAEQTMILTMSVAGSWNTFWLGLTDQVSTVCRSDRLTVCSSVLRKTLIGLTDQIKNVQGQYTWVDNTNLGSNTNWAAGQPDNSFFTSGGNCVEILNNPADGKWTTAACTSKRSFVCEKDKAYFVSDSQCVSPEDR